MIEVVMILRVHALYNRSKLILSFLLVIYIVELVIVFVTRALYSDSKYVMGAYQTNLLLHGTHYKST